MTTLRAGKTEVAAHVRAFAEDETGDVPGWVLVTLMTAGLPALTV